MTTDQDGNGAAVSESDNSRESGTSPEFQAWWAAWQIAQECEGYRFDQPSYDIKLDHIYELASGLLEYLAERVG